MDSPLASVLLDQLQPLFLDPDFDSLFNKLTEGESNSARFLLKMELNRPGLPVSGYWTCVAKAIRAKSCNMAPLFTTSANMI